MRGRFGLISYIVSTLIAIQPIGLNSSFRSRFWPPPKRLWAQLIPMKAIVPQSVAEACNEQMSARMPYITRDGKSFRKPCTAATHCTADKTGERGSGDDPSGSPVLYRCPQDARFCEGDPSARRAAWTNPHMTTSGTFECPSPGA
jgi:hypothetical protein